MKIVAFALLMTLSAVNAASVFTMNVKEKMTVDFLTGFESGIFLRNNTKQFEEYGCPDQQADSKEIAAIKLGLEPIKQLGSKGTFTGGKPIPELVDIIDTIMLFSDSFDKFIGVFDSEFTGGDFCAGLTFGMQGTKMLEKVATTLYNNHLKTKAQEARSHASGDKSGL